VAGDLILLTIFLFFFCFACFCLFLRVFACFCLFAYSVPCPHFTIQPSGDGGMLEF